MKTLATILALGGLGLAAPAALAQQQQGTQQHWQQGQQGQQGQQSIEQLGPHAAQQLAQQPELQAALKTMPDDARNAITKAAQAQGGQLVGVGRDTRDGDKNFVAQIMRGGTLYELKVNSDGKVTSWEPKTR